MSVLYSPPAKGEPTNYENEMRDVGGYPSGLWPPPLEKRGGVDLSITRCYTLINSPPAKGEPTSYENEMSVVGGCVQSIL